jgi:hypothetical protein
MVGNLNAEAGEIQTGTVNGYPAALVEIAGRQGEVDYRGSVAIILLEERGIGLLSMATPDQWDAFGPAFMVILDNIRFFEPEG